MKASRSLTIIALLAATTTLTKTYQLNSMPIRKKKVTIEKLRAAKLTKGKKFFTVGSSNGVPLPQKNHDDLEWTGEVFIGSDLQPITVQFDTGSSFLWVFSSLCHSDVCAPHKRYDQTTSTTHVKDDRPYEIEYGQGFSRGFISQDSVSIAGLQIKNVGFGEGIEVSEDEKNDSADGVLGLGYFGITKDMLPTVFDLMAEQNLVPTRSYSFYFTQTPGSEGSQLIFGGSDPQYYTGSLTYHDVVLRQWWTIRINGVSFDGIKYPGDPKHGQYYGIADTGTSYLYGPSVIFDPIVKKISDGKETVDCEKVSELPDIQITVDETVYTITSRTYIVKAVELGKNQCFVAVGSSDEFPDFILGDVFLMQYYSHWDLDNNRIGFAPAVKK